MAFPVPAHLPRKAVPQDVTAGILSKIDEATTKSLSAAQAKEWLDELNTTIRSTKVMVSCSFLKSLLNEGPRREYMTEYRVIYPSLSNNSHPPSPYRRG
jgi:hypothetical protein